MNAINTRKKRNDSITAATEAFQKANVEIAPPIGVSLKTEEEQTIWRQFTRARSVDAWRDFDLVLLSKVVRIEADLRKYQAMLDTSGPLIKNKRETLIENPLLRVIDTLQRQQLAIIRSMSLNSTGHDPRTLNDSAKAEEQARKVLQQHGVESLLATPMH